MFVFETATEWYDRFPEPHGSRLGTGRHRRRRPRRRVASDVFRRHSQDSEGPLNFAGVEALTSGDRTLARSCHPQQNEGLEQLARPQHESMAACRIRTSAVIRVFTDRLACPEPIARLLVSRGISTHIARGRSYFLNPNARLTSTLASPHAGHGSRRCSHPAGHQPPPNPSSSTGTTMSTAPPPPSCSRPPSIGYHPPGLGLQLVTWHVPAPHPRGLRHPDRRG